MAVWMVRAGKNGEQEERALELGLAVIGWDDVGDISDISEESALQQVLSKVYPDAKPRGIINWRSQIWAFSKKIKIGDVVVLPLKTTGEIALGEVTGDYAYRTELGQGMRHTRSIKWLITTLPRYKFKQDILNTLGAFMTVCRVISNNAEERIMAVLEGKPDEPPPDESLPPTTDLALAANDRIVRHISTEFPGVEMEKLVEAVLQAMGYHTMRKESGVKDKGVDVIAGRGELGFGEPRICVQVKHTQNPVDRPTVQQLIGAMDDFRAERGLFVSWGGFKSTVTDMERDQFFKIRLWTQKTFVGKILKHFDKLPNDIKQRLKLRSIWALEHEAEEELELSSQ